MCDPSTFLTLREQIAQDMQQPSIPGHDGISPLDTPELERERQARAHHSDLFWARWHITR